MLKFHTSFGHDLQPWLGFEGICRGFADEIWAINYVHAQVVAVCGRKFKGVGLRWFFFLVSELMYGNILVYEVWNINIIMFFCRYYLDSIIEDLAVINYYHIILGSLYCTRVHILNTFCCKKKYYYKWRASRLTRNKLTNILFNEFNCLCLKMLSI